MIELSADPVINNFGIADSSERSRDSREPDEQVLRFLAFANDLELTSYNGVLREFLDDFMEQNAEKPEDHIDVLRNKFTSALKNCKSVFGNDVFTDTSRDRRRQGLVHYDLLMVTVGLISEEVALDKEELIKGAYHDLCASESFRRTLSGGLQTKSSILRRRKLWEPLLNDAIE